ncbi:hypothetical protein AM587_10001642 [Phytophthora nicotianae]|uniref:Uncharacterized protein n=1 Tax=Phytophthora nicotianae TaxID=4792 RepID=A0A0W8E0D7_PHYNI|nr:hypothetical protein AM587_10001642 [Phytophthora nicotianae]
MDGLYFDAASSKDYQDAALLALMWYAFGRASDLGFVAKSNLTVSADGVVFVRLLRVKTSEEQGISIFPDQIPQAYVYWTTLNLLPDTKTESPIPLAEALAACDGVDTETPHETSSEPRTKKRKPNDDNMKIHAYVNRIVKSASEAQTRAKPTPNLTSHHSAAVVASMRKWSFERGSWNMTSTNKAFAYGFNTTSEDQKVARVLSGWDASAKLEVPTLSSFDSATREQSRRIANLLFQTSICAEDPSKRLSDRVCKVLTASLIQHFLRF